MKEKILIIHQHFAFPDSGSATRIYDLAKKFAENNYDVEVICGSGYINKKYAKNRFWNTIKKDGITVRCLQTNYSNNDSFYKRIFYFLYFLFFSTWKIFFTKSDLVIATSTPLTVGIPALINKLLTRTKFIFEVRDVWPSVPIKLGELKNKTLIKIALILEKKIYKNADFIVALSVDMKQNIVNRFPAFNNKIDVIANIAEIDRFSENNSGLIHEKKYVELCKNKKVLLYTGTFGKVNGLLFVCELFSEVAKIDEQIVFVCFGNGREKEQIINRAKALQILEKNFFIFDLIPKQELPSVIALSTVSSSWVIDVEELWANSANKYFDALAAGKPIVINYGGWQKNEIESNKTGIVLDYHCANYRQKALRLVSFMNDTEVLKQASQNAKKLATEKYSLDKATEKYLKIIKEIIP